MFLSETGISHLPRQTHSVGLDGILERIWTFFTKTDREAIGFCEKFPNSVQNSIEAATGPNEAMPN